MTDQKKEQIRKQSLIMPEKLPTAKVVIRANEDGIDVNYGPLVAGNLNGLPFITEDWRMDQLGLPYVIMDNVPEFLLDFVLDVELSEKSGNKFSVFPLEKEDIAQLGVALSKVAGGRWVGARHKSRWLQTWRNGVVENAHQTIDAFYLDMTPEQIERSKF